MAKGHRSKIKREREMKLEIQDLQQSYLMLECLYRKLVSF